MLGERTSYYQIKDIPPQDLLNVVLTEPYYNLRNIACSRFHKEAVMDNDNNREPFIVWPPINKQPEPWLPVLLARVALHELQNHLFSNGSLIVIGVPQSATWYADRIQEYGIFPNAIYPQVLKKEQIDNLQIDTTNARSLPVPSYVHNRDPLTRERNPQDMYFFSPEIYQDATLLIVDDAIAQGTTLESIAQFAKEKLEVNQVLVASPMAKAIQGGLKCLTRSIIIDGFSVLINVIQTHGKNGPIFYKSTFTETKI